MDKTLLRQQLLEARLALPGSERVAKSSKIVQNLSDLFTDWSNIKTLHCFEPIESLGEVYIRPFYELAQQHCDVYTSRKLNAEWRIVALSGDGSVPERFDVIIVPMLGFDESLNRLGYGGGYYDKFLAMQPNARKVGVCFEIGKVNRIPVEPHDIEPDQIVTETQVYNIN